MNPFSSRLYADVPAPDHPSSAEPEPTGSVTLFVPVRELDARTLKRLDDYRAPRWDYASLFGPVDDGSTR